HLVLLGAGLDGDAWSTGRDEDGRQPCPTAGMRDQYSVTGYVATGGEACSAHGKESRSRDQGETIPVRGGQVQRVRIESDTQRNRPARTRERVPCTSGSPGRSSAYSKRREAQSAWRRRRRRGRSIAGACRGRICT